MRVYVAGKYSGDDVLQILNNIHVGIKKCVELIKRGYTPFCPWLDHQFQFYDTTLTKDDYYKYSLSWLEVCDVVFILPYGIENAGVRKELARARELNIPVVWSDKELDASKNKRNDL